MENLCTHPNPQFARTTYQDLNGEWEFGFQKARRGFRFSKDFSRAEKLCAAASYPYKIRVPFCVESTLSGIGYTDFIHLAWYRKFVQMQKGDGRVFLHVGAADYLTTVLVNGKPAGRHTGGYTSFALEITKLVHDGENEIFILCEDDTRSGLVPSGKQSARKKSYGCSYTRTTGIWQDVYLEYTPQSYIQSIRLYPDPAAGRVTVHAALCGKGGLRCEAFYKGSPVGLQEVQNACGEAVVQIPLAETHLWEAGHGRLYDLKLTFCGDTVESYFGLRAVRLCGMRFLLNEKPVFQRLVLDQGDYRDGIYTAPDDAARIRDIELAQSAGFNGARLHQKVFDPRFLYFCDKRGYLVWGEFGSWGLDTSDAAALEVFLPQWLEALARDCNHPSIVGWCPFNETWDTHGRKQRDGLLTAVYDATKAFDPTRPCIDTSGNFHVKTDIYDVHDYRYDPAEFKASFDRLETDGELYEHVLQDHPGRQRYNGEPTFVSEYGGIKWAADAQYKSWGYGEDVHNETDFAARYAGLTAALTGNRKMFGFCYTQLYDVEQEQNGLFTYDRKPKFADATYREIKAANEAPAAMEADEEGGAQ